MKFKGIHNRAEILDDLVDAYISVKNTPFVPLNQMQDIVPLVFPDAQLLSLGIHKLVFQLKHKHHNLVLKVGKKDAIENDHRAYKQLPASFRHAYFAKVFWHTRYCLLQEYGVQTEVTGEELSKLRSIASNFGLLDISCENIRSVRGYLKIVDAGIAPEGLFKLWKAADFISLRLPPPVRRVVRRSRMLRAISGR